MAETSAPPSDSTDAATAGRPTPETTSGAPPRADSIPADPPPQGGADADEGHEQGASRAS